MSVLWAMFRISAYSSKWTVLEIPIQLFLLLLLVYSRIRVLGGFIHAHIK